MAFRLPFAAQPDMVLAAEKDQLQIRELRDQVYMVAEGAFGPQTTTGAKPELSLLADLFYMFLTTAKGRQTLGEEYCDLYLVEPNARHRLSVDKRFLLALIVSIGPYIVARLSMGGWASLWSALRRETARERAAALMRRAQAQQQQMAMNLLNERSNASNSSSSSSPSPLSWPLSWLKSLEKVNWTQLLLTSWPILSRIHLASFYWAGEYLDPAKRLVRARYAFTREPAAQRPTYRILSVFILIQMGMQFSNFVEDKLAKGEDSPSSSSGSSSVVVECVPSLTNDEAEAQSQRAQSLFSNACGICLSPLRSPACPPCGHVYCYECIVESCLAKSECPLCRRQASPQSVQCIYV